METTTVELKHNRGIRVISDIRTALNYVRGQKCRKVTYLNTKTRKCLKCGNTFTNNDMHQNKHGNTFHICKECFKNACKENASKRVKADCIIDYTPKKTIEPCRFCKNVTATNKYYKSLNLASCDDCYTNLNRVCGHVKTMVIA